MKENLKLLNYLAQFAYKYDRDNPLTLSSGALSHEYLDCKLALSNPKVLNILGKVFYKSLIPGIEAIGGLTMGADPIAISTSCFSAKCMFQTPINWFSVRKEPKAYGQNKFIEGLVSVGQRVAVVDDVVTKGQSTIKAINICRDFGLEVAQVLVLVDRQEYNGMENICKAAGKGAEVSAIFTKSDIEKRGIK